MLAASGSVAISLAVHACPPNPCKVQSITGILATSQEEPRREARVCTIGWAAEQMGGPSWKPAR